MQCTFHLSIELPGFIRLNMLSINAGGLLLSITAAAGGRKTECGKGLNSMHQVYSCLFVFGCKQLNCLTAHGYGCSSIQNRAKLKVVPSRFVVGKVEILFMFVNVYVEYFSTGLVLY